MCFYKISITFDLFNAHVEYTETKENTDKKWVHNE